MRPVIDLHAHSTASDGTDTPAALVHKAAAQGIDVLALTDHDTTLGWEEATVAAAHVGLRLVRGIELSTRNHGIGQHLLAYEPDPDHPALRAVLDVATGSRGARTEAILARLADLGHHLTLAQVTAHSPTGTIGKPHIADALVAAGICTDRDDAFDRFLGKGRPADVSRPVPDIEDAIGAVVAAGGRPVLAHPGGRGAQASEARFAELAALGLVGIEVDHQEHDPHTRRRLAGIATNLGLLATGSSDHHGTGKINHDLGCNTTHPDVLDALLA